jgi:hypothetical protein
VDVLHLVRREDAQAQATAAQATRMQVALHSFTSVIVVGRRDLFPATALVNRLISHPTGAPLPRQYRQRAKITTVTRVKIAGPRTAKIASPVAAKVANRQKSATPA